MKRFDDLMDSPNNGSILYACKVYVKIKSEKVMAFAINISLKYILC